MPASETPESEAAGGGGGEGVETMGSPSPGEGDRTDGPNVTGLLDRTASGIGAVLEEVSRLRERVERAEGVQRRMAEALEDGDLADMSADALQERLGELAEENRRLRGVVAEARERADRIRSRLMVVEDET